MMAPGEEVKALRDKIAAACPDVKFELLDYGRSLYGYKLGPDNGIDRHTYRTILRSARPPDPELDFAGQCEVRPDIDKLIEFWRAA